VNVEDANLLLDPECLSLENWVGPEGIGEQPEGRTFQEGICW